MEMEPRLAWMCLPMNVAVGLGSSADLGLTRKPADWSWSTAAETAEESVAGDEETKAASSRYCAVCAACGWIGGVLGER